MGQLDFSDGEIRYKTSIVENDISPENAVNSLELG